MTKIQLLLIISAVLPIGASAQDTFSICAYDSLTGQLGSAGATCIQGATSAIIISDVVPGKGVVHTQASWIAVNQNYAHSLLLLGLTPQQIIDSVQLHDGQGNPSIRQYGVVDVNGASAAFTGAACLNYHNHITGPGYSIQGNILLGQQILDSMESRFLNSPGDLACRLMAALQGAKVSGADTRCSSLGISAVSAFIRVANPADTGGVPFYLDISVNTYPNYSEPIDSLQQRFYLWGGCGPNGVTSPGINQEINVYPVPAEDKLAISSRQSAIIAVGVLNQQGQTVISTDRSVEKPTRSIEIDISDLQAGIYFLRIRMESGEILTRKIVRQ